MCIAQSHKPVPLGFTLLEVLVALVILTVAIGAVVSQAGSLNRNGTHLTNKTYALWVAQNRLGELQLGNSRLAITDTRGEAELGGRKWYWTQRVSNVGTGVVLQRIDVRVYTEPLKATLASRQNLPLVELTGFMSGDLGS